MKPDPNFPDRPTHPDYDLLSKIAIDQDRHGVDVGSYTSTEVDPDSLVYLAQNRAGLAVEAFTKGNRDLGPQGLVTAGILDGFMLGVRFAKARLIQSEDKWIAPDGTNRKD